MNASSIAATVTKHSRGLADLSGHVEWLIGLIVLIALIYLLMWRSWRRRAQRQSNGLPQLPAVPADAGDTRARLTGRYIASTTAGAWLERITAHGLGARSLAELALTDAGIVVERPAADSFLIPAAALRGARLDQGIAGKVVPEGGLLVITWRHGDRLIDSGFRADHPAGHPAWVTAVNDMTSSTEGVR